MVSIVLLCHNKARYTRACIESLLATRPADFELVVVNNGSTDETPQVLEELRARLEQTGARFRLIATERNLGCSTARNAAVAAAQGREIVFLDNDTLLPDPAWLVKLSAALNAAPDIAIVGPKLCYPFEPHRIQCAGVAITPGGRVIFRGRGEAAHDPRYARIEEVQCLISACFIFRRSLYDEIGGLDEAFNPIQFEDFDFCYRARSRGGRCLYTPEPVVYHWESVTSDGTPALPNRYIIIKHGMLFKQRWHHMFARENGPPDEAAVWKTFDLPSLHGPRRR